MSNLPVASRLKAPTSRIAKSGTAKSEAVTAPRTSGLKPPSSSAETPQKSGLKQPLLKRSTGAAEAQKSEKRSALPTTNSTGLSTPRTKQNGTQSKLKSGIQPRGVSSETTPLKRDSLTPRDGSSTNLKRQSSSSHSSLSKESPTPSPMLAREKTQESIKDETTGILFKVGDRVLVAGSKSGVIEYLGETKFAKGLWAGVKLDEAGGKNDGSVAGVRYFDCEPSHGVFSKPNRLHKINIVPKNSTSDHAILDDSSTLKIGDQVIVSGTKVGVLRYLGPTEFAKGEWAGIELEEALGKNDGAVAGTRYFTCEMKYGLFAPSSKVTKSKKKVLSKKPLSSPGPSLDIAAKMVFNRTSSMNSDVSNITSVSAAAAPHPGSPTEKVVPQTNELATSNESLHSGVKKTPSNSQQVAALQSALEEREREIHKMLMERELEKDEKLKGFESSGKGNGNEFNDKLLKEKDEIINALKDNLAKATKENSETRAKLDEEKKKYEDLQFMLEEEKITDDELKNHVRQDEDKIKELSTQYEERNMKIKELQKELSEVRSDKLSNEAKMLELRDQLAESRTSFQSLKKNMDTEVEENDQNQQLETSLEIVKKELSKTKKILGEKENKVDELERKLTEQMNKHEETQEQNKKEMNQKLTAAENERKKVIEDYELMKAEKERYNEELVKTKREKAAVESNLQLNEEKLEASEKRYKDIMEENLLASNQKDEASKIAVVNLKTRIAELEGELLESKTKTSQLENNMALENDIAQQKTKQLESLLANTNKLLVETKEDANKKTQLVNDLENKLNTQLTRQKEIEKEVESLGEADKNLTLMKEAHRSEVDALESKVASLAKDLKDLQNKQKILTQDHRNELTLVETARDDEVNKLKERMHSNEIERGNLVKECETLKSDKNKTKEELAKIQQEHNTIQQNNNTLSQKLKDLSEKCEELSKAKLEITTERNDAIQLCEEQDRQLEVFKADNDKMTSEKQSLTKDRDNLLVEIISLETQIENLNSDSSQKQGQQQKAMQSEIAALKSKLDEVKKHNVEKVNTLTEEKENLENLLANKTNEIKRLLGEQYKMQERSQQLEGQVSNLKKKMSDAAENATNKTENLSNEILILKDDFEEAKGALKQKEDEIRLYKEQIEKMGNGEFPKSPMDGDILENASALMLRLHEAESKLAVVQSEKESAEEQVEFLNSIIVDLQKANQTIALLEAGDEAILLHGLESESDDELMVKPKYAMRTFCDICDVFDQHETDECPLQEGGDDSGGVQHHGDRNHERPYCGICEVFGHWSEDCNDEQTF
ncbi:CAP-Gly domain-containing linker protein 1-like isoform X2 [Dendronephthya gigantea]|uniref:CAP-Gly domain-containing linker protein 1-like isoform X2 n=1 Tax=Dendronephthya gigantea TaxID=151771 RepID=UPI00106CAD96|nr:CAP-Gly domain-containing linker protein 1-like isoform X2 [Dendronephthya gigantea]